MHPFILPPLNICTSHIHCTPCQDQAPSLTLSSALFSLSSPRVNSDSMHGVRIHPFMPLHWRGPCPNEASFHDMMGGKAQSEDLLTPRTSRLRIAHPTSRSYTMPPTTPSTKADLSADRGDRGSSRQTPSLEAMANFYQSIIKTCKTKLQTAQSELATARSSAADEQVKERTANLKAAKRFGKLNSQAIERREKKMQHQMNTTGSDVSLVITTDV
jgi:hypothetical protein